MSSAEVSFDCAVDLGELQVIILQDCSSFFVLFDAKKGKKQLSFGEADF